MKSPTPLCLPCVLGLFFATVPPLQSEPARVSTITEQLPAVPSGKVSLPAASSSTRMFNPEAARTLIEQGIDEVLFVRRFTLNANHVYTEYVNSKWMPGGGLCVLDLRTGEVRELASELTKSGVVNRFDLSFDATRVLFDFKCSEGEGYRLYEIGVDGTGLRQVTFPPENEAQLVSRYRKGYHHGTDDMHPCYLADGGIVFATTRCQYGVLCDGSDNFTVKNLYRIDADGGNMRPLTNSALSEATPSLLPDGRILYHRWEYIDKTAGNIKGLWAMNPDGSGSTEIYGNDIAFPETLIYARPIPEAPGKIVMLGTSHCCPNNAMGSVIKIDVSDSIRAPETMQFITPDIHALRHNGFNFMDENGEWIYDQNGTAGRLFKDPYPVSENLYIVAHKPKGEPWDTPNGYEISLLDGSGNTTSLYNDEMVSCWHPYPLKPRNKPPLVGASLDSTLARDGLAKCIVADVYSGLEGVKRGVVRHIRILEELGRPWAARKDWNDRHGQTHAHSVIGNGTLGLKVLHGIVPVEPDGSAYFYVPAMRNIYFQALDENYMAVQTERTYVNYMPGETRSCVGCHETPDVAPFSSSKALTAILRKPSLPGPQPEQLPAARVFDYERQIQPIWDKHCVTCHNDEENAGGLNLAGTPVENFSVSYDQLIALSKTPKQLLGFRSARNEDAASLGQDAMQYLPPYTFCSPTSPLIGWLSGGKVTMRDSSLDRYVERLESSHPGITISESAFIRLVTWVDVNCPFHPSYWGRFNTKFIGHPNYRPEVTFEEAQMREVPRSVRQSEAWGANQNGKSDTVIRKAPVTDDLNGKLR